MRYLAIDLGQKRTGLAIGDDVTALVSPLTVIEDASEPGIVEQVLVQVADQAPDALVLGLPLNMDGTEGNAAKRSRSFGALLEARCELPIHYQDERLTSYAADQLMARSGRTHQQKKKLRDALAAAEILRDFLDARI